VGSEVTSSIAAAATAAAAAAASVMPLQTARVGQQPMRISSTASRQINDKAISWNAPAKPTGGAWERPEPRCRQTRRLLFDAASFFPRRRRRYVWCYTLGHRTYRGVRRYRISALM